MFDWRTKTDDEIAEFVIKQMGRLEQLRQIYESLWNVIIKLFKPRRYDLLGDGTKKGARYGAKVYDPEPASAMRKAARGYSGNMIGRDNNEPFWLNFETPIQWLMRNDDVKTYFQNCQEQVRYGFSQSTFYREHLPFLEDAFTLGNAVMIPEENEAEDQMVFKTIHPRDNFFTVDRFGKIDGYQRPVTFEAKTALEQFDKDKLPQRLIKDAEGRNPFSEWKFIHAIYKNVQKDSRFVGTLSKPWISFYVLKTGSGQRKTTRKLVSMEGQDYGPIVLRLGVESGMTYGTGYAADALTGALYGNTLAKKTLRQAHLLVEGRWMGHKSLTGKFRRKAGGVTWTDDLVKKRIESLVERSAQWQVGEMELRKINDAVGDVFFSDFFEMVSRSREGPQMTAYQVSQIVAEKIPQMTPVLEAMEDDDLEPASDVIWNSESAKGRMPDVPQILLDEAGNRTLPIANRYMGKLAVLSRTANQSQGIAAQLELMRVLVELWPSAALRVESADYLEYAMTNRGMPQRMITPDAKFAEIQAAIAQRDQEDRELEKAERMSKILPAAGKVAEKGSLMGEAAA